MSTSTYATPILSTCKIEDTPALEPLTVNATIGEINQEYKEDLGKFLIKIPFNYVNANGREVTTTETYFLRPETFSKDYSARISELAGRKNELEGPEKSEYWGFIFTVGNVLRPLFVYAGLSNDLGNFGLLTNRSVRIKLEENMRNPGFYTVKRVAGKAR